MRMSDDRKQEISLDDGRMVVVWLAGELVVVEVPGIWRQEFTREQAWELMEAIDAVSTAADPANAEQP